MKASLRIIPLGIFFILLGAFSFWLMFHTFSIEKESGDLLVSAKVYSDFGAHIPLIRSFSRGQNWPPEHPLFPGEAIRYHFLFYFFIGILERIGIRLDLALNTISAAGFFSMCLLIFTTARSLFRSSAVGTLSIFFFLFNGSFSFLDFISSRSISVNTLSDLVTNTTFPSFAPWNNSLISAFWNLNIYTNQRHLAISFAICLLIIYLLNSSTKLKTTVGFLLGSLLLLNQAAFLIGVIFYLHFLLAKRFSVKHLIWTILGLLPWIGLWLLVMSPVSSLPVFKPGYLLPAGSSATGFLWYWLSNLGLHMLLIPLGIIFAPYRLRRFWLPVFLLFLLPNLFRFSIDMVNNHKLLNFFMIFGAMFSAGLINHIWTVYRRYRIVVLIVLPFLCLGGVVDFFPVFNDYQIRISDYYHSRDVAFIQENTPKNAVFLNDTWLYHPASLSGRRIFNGYPYFTWSYGYDNTTRENDTVKMYRSGPTESGCFLFRQKRIDYIQIGTSPEDFLKSVDRSWISQLTPLYFNPETGFMIYSVRDNCR